MSERAAARRQQEASGDQEAVELSAGPLSPGAAHSAQVMTALAESIHCVTPPSLHTENKPSDHTAEAAGAARYKRLLFSAQAVLFPRSCCDTKILRYRVAVWRPPGSSCTKKKNTHTRCCRRESNTRYGSAVPSRPRGCIRYRGWDQRVELRLNSTP